MKLSYSTYKLLNYFHYYQVTMSWDYYSYLSTNSFHPWNFAFNIHLQLNQTIIEDTPYNLTTIYKHLLRIDHLKINQSPKNASKPLTYKWSTNREKTLILISLLLYLEKNYYVFISFFLKANRYLLVPSM